MGLKFTGRHKEQRFTDCETCGGERRPGDMAFITFQYGDKEVELKVCNRCAYQAEKAVRQQLRDRNRGRREDARTAAVARRRAADAAKAAAVVLELKPAEAEYTREAFERDRFGTAGPLAQPSLFDAEAATA